MNRKSISGLVGIVVGGATGLDAVSESAAIAIARGAGSQASDGKYQAEQDHRGRAQQARPSLPFRILQT